MRSGLPGITGGVLVFGRLEAIWWGWRFSLFSSGVYPSTERPALKYWNVGPVEVRWLL